jgi:lipoprotein-anchoring transpeptidase ErfK/SrfK
LRTPTGTFHVLRKSPSYVLSSPWPRSRPEWYPDTTVHHYMAVTDTGVALYGAEWEPPSAFGAGSQDGPRATHGQVNLPTDAASQLYKWAPVGTTVVIDESGSPLARKLFPRPLLRRAGECSGSAGWRRCEAASRTP